MATITPVWLDNQAIISDQVLALGSVIAGTIDLRTALEAWLYLAVGRGGTTALTGGGKVIVRPTLNNNALLHPAALVARDFSILAASSTTVSADSAAGQKVLTVASGTGFAANDELCIQDSGGGVTRLEFARISKIAGGTITFDHNLQFTHTAAQADTVRNRADCFPPLLIPGGAVYEVVFDYGAPATGPNLTVRAIAQIHTHDLVVG